MNRGSFLIGLVALGLAVTPAFGQYKPTVQIKPKVPIIKLIPPSAAVNQALAMNPGSKALAVKPGPNNSYIIRLQKGGKVMNFKVDGTQ